MLWESRRESRPRQGGEMRQRCRILVMSLGLLLALGMSGPASAQKQGGTLRDRKSTRLNSSHSQISYAVFCLKKKKKNKTSHTQSHDHTTQPNDPTTSHPYITCPRSIHHLRVYLATYLLSSQPRHPDPPHRTR